MFINKIVLLSKAEGINDAKVLFAEIFYNIPNEISHF